MICTWLTQTGGCRQIRTRPSGRNLVGMLSDASSTITTLITRSYAIAQTTARPSFIVGLLVQTRQMAPLCYYCMADCTPILIALRQIPEQFYQVMGPDIYRIRWTNAEYRPLRRSRSFKVTKFGTNGKHVCDFLCVNNSNLLYLCPCTFPRYDGLLVQFSLTQGGASV